MRRLALLPWLLWLGCKGTDTDRPGETDPGDTDPADTDVQDTDTDVGDTDDTDVPGDPPYRPFPQHTAYFGATLPSDPQGQLDDAVRDFYADWKQHYVLDLGDGRFRVLFDRGADAETVSEGQGYGMVIVAYMAGEDPDAQPIFDGMWAFVKDHPSDQDGRLMDWHVPADEAAEPGDDDSAFDGDADIAYALLLADAQWGSTGAVDYRGDALQLISAIDQSTIGPDSDLPLLGDWVDPDGRDYDQWTVRTSDFMPDHFASYAAATGDSRWDDVVAATGARVEGLQDGYAPETGLLPDFTVPISDSDTLPMPAPRNFLEGAADGAYSYNAGRDPWRLGTHAVLFDAPISRAQAVRISEWAATATGGDPQALKAGYELDGTPLRNSDYFTTFFAAPIGVAALSGDDPAWTDAVWDSVKDTHEGYYEDSVTLQCLIVMSGNAWAP